MPGYDKLRLPPEYQALTSLDTRGFAWEWLRRIPEFRDLWRSAPPATQRAVAGAGAAIRRSARPLVDIARHPLARRWSHWGLTFRTRSRHPGHARGAHRLAPGDRYVHSDPSPARAVGTHA
jgi:hypothetical protein